MLQTYEAILNNGQIHWIDVPPNSNGRLHITFIEHTKPQIERKLGFMRGEIQMPDDINFADDEVAKLFGVDLK